MTHEDAESEHNRLYREALAAVRPLIEVHGRPVQKPTAAQQSELRRGIGLFDRVLHINPRNWAAIWLVGKAYQRLREFDHALDWFSRAHNINPSQPDVSREAAIAAMELGRPLDAIPFCESAIKAKPSDPGLYANLALAILFSGDANRAEMIVRDALHRDPADKITLHIAEVCRAVLAGERACPRHARDMA
jgi:tetratricopeptide (TPR) repeat protein